MAAMTEIEPEHIRPASANARIISALELAGPNVATIFARHFCWIIIMSSRMLAR